MNRLIRELFAEEYLYQGTIHEELGARLKMPYIIVFPAIIVVCILLLIVNIKNNKNKKSKIACSILLLLFILLIIYVMCIAYTTEWKAISLDI